MTNEPVNENYQTGGQFTAADEDAIAHQVNLLEKEAPLSSLYRPLRGYRSDVTVSAENGNTTGASGYSNYIWSDSTRFRYSGAAPVAYTGIGAGIGVDNNSPYSNTGGTNYNQIFAVEFWTNATQVRWYQGSTVDTDILATVDDQLISYAPIYTPITVTTSPLTIEYSISGPAVFHKWRIFTRASIGGVGINTAALIRATAPVSSILLIGDGYVTGGQIVTNARGAGNNGTLWFNCIPGTLSVITGLDVWCQGIDGVGYAANTVDSDNGKLIGSAGNVASIAAMPPMAAVIMMGSVDDGNAYQSNPTTTIAAYQAAWAAVNGAQPNAPLIVTGVPNAVSFVGSQWDNLNNAIKAAAAANPIVDGFIDVRPLVTPNNIDVFLNDSSWISPTGAQHYAEFIAAMIGPILVSV